LSFDDYSDGYFDNDVEDADDDEDADECG